MNIRLTRDILHTALQATQAIVERRTTMPILANILLTAQAPDTLTVTATDLEIGLEATYPVTVDKPGAITLPALKLFEIVNAIREQDLSLVVGDNNWMTLTAGRSHFRLAGLPQKDYPELPPGPTDNLLPIPVSGLRTLFSKTLFAVADKNHRYTLNGLYLTVIPLENNHVTVRTVGTDGHRLGLAEHTISCDPVLMPQEETALIIPQKAASYIRRLLDHDEEQCSLGFTPNRLIVRKPDMILTSRLIEGTYPNYKQVIPTKPMEKALIPKTDLLGALRRVSLVKKDTSCPIKFTLSKKELLLSSENPEMGTAKETIPVTFKGKAYSTGFNGKYLLDLLPLLETDTFSLQMESPLSPCLVQEHEGHAGNKFILMPLKI